MTNRYISIFFILCLAIGNELVAQPNWSLNQCISFSIENNVNLRQYEIQEKIAHEDFSQSKRDLLPGISASSSAGISFGRSVDPNTNDIVNTEFFNNSYNLGASITLFNGFRLQNQIQYEKFRKRISELDHRNAIDDLAFSVMSSFYEVIYYQGMLQIAKEQVETSKLKLKAIEKQSELGLKARTDLLEMRANLEAEELRRIQMDNSLKSAMLLLQQRMNLSDTTHLVLQDQPEDPMAHTAPDKQSLFNSYLQWSPFYQSFATQLQASRKILSISRSHLYPSLSASGSMSTGYYETTRDDQKKTISFGNQIDNNRSQYLGASLSIPIFSRWAVRSDIKKAKLQLEQAQSRLEQEKQKIYYEMADNLNQMEAADKEFNQYKKQQEADREAFHAAEKKFEQGLISVVDFYVAKNRMANSASQVLRTRLQYEVKCRMLDFYSGTRFWE